MSEPRAKETTVQQDYESQRRKETYGNYGPLKRPLVDLGIVRPWNQADAETQARETRRATSPGIFRYLFD